MARKRTLETDQQRSARAKKTAEQRITTKLKDAELDTMVQQSIKHHGP